MARIRCGKLLLVFVCVIAIAGVAHAGNLIVNGSFEDGDFSHANWSWERLASGSSYLTGWTVGGSGVDWHNTSEFSPILYGGKAVDLNLDSSSSRGTLSQTFSTVTGQWYELDFYMAAPGTGWGDMRWVGVSIAGINAGFGTMSSGNLNLGWELFSLTFQASSVNTTLTFSNPSGSGGYWGPVLDNVSVEAVPTPEPTTILMVGSGLIGMAALRRKYTK